MKLKKFTRILRLILGWILIVMGGFSCVVSGICAICALFGLLEIDSIAERLAAIITYLVMTIGFFVIFRLGFRLKNGGRKDKTAPPAKRESAPKAAQVSNSRGVPEPDAPTSDYLDDITFIQSMRHTPIHGGWQQYDVLLAAMGYGWDMMKDWADYMSTADLELISQVETGTMSAETLDVTKSYTEHGKKCTQTPELDVEQGMLSIAGMSKILRSPVKIVWINQTRTLRLFTTTENDLLMQKYIETVIRRSFGTANAMKLGKPIPSPEKAPEKPAPEKEKQNTSQPAKTPAQSAPEKNPQSESAPQKLNLGTFSFTDADRQKLAELPKKGLPEKTNTAEAQIALLNALDPFMNTAMAKARTAKAWDSPDGMSEEEKAKRIRSNIGVTIQTVDASLTLYSSKTDRLEKMVEDADFDQLLNAWAVLNYYSGVVAPQYTENIRNYRDYIHLALLTRYDNFDRACLVPAKLEGTGIYVESAPLLEWLKNSASYALQGVMPLTEKEPVITLYEDGVMTREYRLQTENDEDFTGKYFLIGVRMGMQGNPSVPVVQIDGFISDTPEDRNMTLADIGYRMEGHFLTCGGKNAKIRRKMNRGQDLPMKALKYVGYTTPSNVRMVGICPDCGKSFCFHAYSLYMEQCDVAYSDDGMECCSISSQGIDIDSWTHQTGGKTFRYYNSFCCPHCGAPYIDYEKFSENKRFGVSGCVHLGRKLYYDNKDNH